MNRDLVRGKVGIKGYIKGNLDATGETIGNNIDLIRGKKK